MSDTEDTEELKTNSISSKKRNIIIDNNIIDEEEQLKIGTIELIGDLFINICEENKTKNVIKIFLSNTSQIKIFLL